MLLRSFFLLLFSSQVFSAGITICSDPIIDISPLPLLENSKINMIESLDLYDKCDHDGVISFQEKNDLSIDYIIKSDDNFIKVKREVSNATHVTVLPPIGESYNKVYLLGDDVYAYSDSLLSLLKWDSALDGWVDVSTIKSLPQGVYSSILPYGSNLIVSIDSGVHKGIWKIGETVVNLSLIPMSKRIVWGSNDGLVQLISNNAGSYKIDYLESSIPSRSIQLNGDITYYKSNVKLDGTLYSFVGDVRGPRIYWDGLNNSQDGFLTMPERARYFRGCFSSTGNIYCAFSSASELVLYIVNDGQFELDAVISDTDSTIMNKAIGSIYSVGKSRFITTFDGSRFSLYEYNEFGLQLHTSTVYENPSDFAGLFYSRDPSVFYWRELKSGMISLTKYTLSGSINYQSLAQLENKDEVIDEVGEFEEREETADEDEEPRPRAEISGAFSPYYLFALMLLLITARRKTTF
jgi:hypothetical protein